MKIVWLCPYPIINFKDKISFLRNGKYHPASWIVNLSNYLSTINEINLNIVTDSGNIRKDIHFMHNNIEFHILKNSMPLFNRSYPWFFPFDIFNKYKSIINKFVNKIAEIKPDIVHAHGTENSYALAGIKSGFPLLVTIQGIINEYYKTNPNINFYLLRKTENEAIKKAKYFACRTLFDVGYVEKINPDARFFKIYEALNPIFLKDNWEKNKTKSILYIASLVKRKGIEDLFKSISILKDKYPDIKLNVIGDGSKKYKKYLLEIINSFGIQNNVIFYGVKSANEYIEFVKHSQIFILPTYNDNYPNALAEAMVSGMPVISTSAGGIKDMITDSENGYLYNPGDTGKLADIIDYLLQNDNERVRIGINATNLRARHTFENVYRQTKNAYEVIISNEKSKIY